MGKCGQMKKVLESFRDSSDGSGNKKPATRAGFLYPPASMRTVAKLSAKKPNSKTGRFRPMDEGKI